MKTVHMNAFAETLRETLEEIPIPQTEVSRATGIPAPHLSAMKHGTRRITAEYDLRLSRYFRTTPGFWLKLQLAADIRRAEAEKAEEIMAEVQPMTVSS